MFELYLLRNDEVDEALFTKSYIIILFLYISFPDMLSNSFILFFEGGSW